MRRKIIRNAARCNHCGDIIESKSRHDYKKCSCGRIAVDGGHDYLRRGYTSPEDFTELSVTQMEGLAEIPVFESSLSEEEVKANFSADDFTAGVFAGLTAGLAALEIIDGDKKQKRDETEDQEK